MEQSNRVVAVTGAAGYVGRRLLKSLEEGGDQRKLVAYDTSPLTFPVHNVAAYRQDVAEPIEATLRRHRVTTLVHLAFNVRPGRNRREIAATRDSNLGMLKSVLDSCLRAGVGHFIYVSSHTVYGPHPDNAIPLPDTAPLRPLPDFPYGYDKFLSEQMIQEFGEQHQGLKITVLRACVVLGPNADDPISKAFFRPVLMGVLDYNPPFQFLYEDDLARVIGIIIGQELPGVFNVAGEGVVFYKELARIIKSKLINLPAVLAYPFVQLTWDLGIQRDSVASGLDLVRYPIVLDSGRLRQVTGYKFWHTSLETLTSFANSCLLFKEDI